MARSSWVVLLMMIGCGGGAPDEHGLAPDLAFPFDPDGGSVCAAFLPNFTPNWVPPPGPRPGLCASADVDAFAAAVASGDTATLQQLAADHPSCDDCLSGQHGLTQGAFLQRPQGFIDGNVAGCVALVSGDPSDNGCAEHVFLQNECANQACAGCIVRIRADFPAYQACVVEALKFPCPAYVTDCVTPALAICESASWPSARDWLRYPRRAVLRSTRRLSAHGSTKRHSP